MLMFYCHGLCYRKLRSTWGFYFLSISNAGFSEVSSQVRTLSSGSIPCPHPRCVELGPAGGARRHIPDWQVPLYIARTLTACSKLGHKRDSFCIFAEFRVLSQPCSRQLPSKTVSFILWRRSWVWPFTTKGNKVNITLQASSLEWVSM